MTTKKKQESKCENSSIVKITLGEINSKGFNTALSEIFQEKSIPARVRWELSDAISEIEKHQKNFEKMLKPVLEPMPKKQDGQTLDTDAMSKEQIEEVNTKVAEISLIEIDIELPKIELTWEQIDKISTSSIHVLKGKLFEKPKE